MLHRPPDTIQAEAIEDFEAGQAEDRRLHESIEYCKQLAKESDESWEKFRHDYPQIGKGRAATERDLFGRRIEPGTGKV